MTFRSILANFSLGIFLLAPSFLAQGVTAAPINTSPTDTLVAAPVRKLSSERLRVAPAPAAPLPPSVDNRLAASVKKTALGASIVKDALAYMGTRYRSGGMTPAGFDCSGFTSYIYKKHNVSILRDSRSQYTQGVAIHDIADLRAGDLVFFGGRSGRQVGHVGIVTEVMPDGQSFKFVHSSSSQGVTLTHSTEPYYRHRYIGAKRILSE